MTKGKRARKHNVTQKHAVIKKKKWVDMEMYRVPLDHTQAVLTCCYSPVRGMRYSAPWEGRLLQCCVSYGCGNSVRDPAGIQEVSS